MFSIRAAGTAARIASTTGPVSASPHSATTAAPARTPGMASAWASAEGTALISEPCQGPAGPRSARASTSGTTSRHPPEVSVPNISNTDTSKLSEVEASTRDSSPAGNADAAQQASDTTPACSIITPLGRPVDPEVYTTYARSRGRAAGPGGLSPAGSSPGRPASRAVAAGSSSRSSGSPPGSPAATDTVVRTVTGADSVSMTAIRPAG